jgi:hypothetical protein
MSPPPDGRASQRPRPLPAHLALEEERGQSRHTQRHTHTLKRHPRPVRDAATSHALPPNTCPASCSFELHACVQRALYRVFALHAYVKKIVLAVCNTRANAFSLLQELSLCRHMHCMYALKELSIACVLCRPARQAQNLQSACTAPAHTPNHPHASPCML